MAATTDPHRDEQLIRSVLERYFYGIDSRDRAIVASCFTDDAKAIYHKGFTTEERHTGGGAIADSLITRISVYSHTNHLGSNTAVTLSGDTAHAVTHAIAHVIYGDIRVRGIRYIDDLVRGADGEWRIAQRTHIPLWQYHAESVTPSVPTK